MSVRTVPTVKAGIAGWLASGLVLAVGFSYFEKFSLLMIGLVALAAAVNLCFTQRVHRYAVVAGCFVVAVFLMGAFIGSVPESVDAWPRWINRDGRVVVAMLPLILLGTTRVRRPDLSLAVRTIEGVVLANLTVFVVGLAGVSAVHQLAFARYTFSGLTSSHHAAGMVFGASTVILAAARRSPELGVRPPVALILCALTLALGSGSRTAAVGLLAAALWLAYERKRLTELFRIAVLLAVVAAVALAFSDKLAGTMAGLLSADFWAEAWQRFSMGMGSTESVHYSGGSGASGESYVANILSRFFYWGIAIGLFLRSPLVGIGSFRFNDVELGFSGVDGFVQLATSGVDNSDDLIGAHNQYLGTLVENGLVGLVFLLSIWVLPYRHLGRSSSPPARIRESGRQMVPYAFGTALTGYTLVSPTLTFVSLTWLALVCMCEEDPP